MSPFLVHMTGRGEILDILKGLNGPATVYAGQGYLKASVPQYQGSTGAFDAKVVCFTETPTFALDFFRYRSFPRWDADQRYGIGFQKALMATSGARPVVYLDYDATRRLVSLRKSFGSLAPATDRETDAKNLLDRIFPLTFPLLETLPSQGFMWEREWRITDPDGFVFPHSNIGIICCPESEDAAIRSVLGPAAASVQFVRTWREYDAITDFLRRQEPIWLAGKKAVSSAASSKERVAAANDLVDEIKASLHALESYEGLAVKHSSELDKIGEERSSLTEQLAAAELELAEAKLQKSDDKRDMGLNS